VSRALLVLGFVVVLAIVFGISCVSIGNNAITLQTKVEAQWSQVQNQYKRRADLVPQLVDTVKGASNYEESVLRGVTEARASAAKAQSQVAEAMPTDEEALKRYAEAQAKLGSAIRTTLYAVAEAYPQLRATQNYSDLQTQLEGNENRIAVARTDYIKSVQEY